MEDAFIAGRSDGSLDILVRPCSLLRVIGFDYPQVIDDAAALASIVGSTTKQPAAAIDSAPSSHRPQSGACAAASTLFLLFFCRSAAAQFSVLLLTFIIAASSRPGSASSRPQSATSRASNITPRSDFVVQTVAKQEQKSGSRPSSARTADADKISESEYVSVGCVFACGVVCTRADDLEQEDFESDDAATGNSARGR